MGSALEELTSADKETTQRGLRDAEIGAQRLRLQGPAQV